MNPASIRRSEAIWATAALSVLLIGSGAVLCLSAETRGFVGGGGRGEIENRVIQSMLFGGGMIAVGVLCGVISVVLSLRRTRERMHLCPKCHYDRTGLAADAVCPECGSPSGSPMGSSV